MNTPVDFYDIYDFYYIPFWHTLWFKIAAGIACALMVAAVIFMLLRRRKPQLQAWEWAEQELKKLIDTPCTRKHEFKKLYFSLTTITKNYLHLRYGWHLANKTDDELIAWLEEQNFDSETVAMLKKIADGALWIKFANMETIRSQADADIKIIQSLIEKTKPHGN